MFNFLIKKQKNDISHSSGENSKNIVRSRIMNSEVEVLDMLQSTTLQKVNEGSKLPEGNPLVDSSKLQGSGDQIVEQLASNTVVKLGIPSVELTDSSIIELGKSVARGKVTFLSQARSFIRDNKENVNKKESAGVFTIPPGGILFRNGTAVDFSAAERFRQLRAKIETFRANQPELKIIGVTSAVPQEGKSMISVNIARYMAMGLGRSLLIDCDLRRPTVHEYFGVTRGPGLSDILHKRELNEAPISHVGNGLDVLFAGTPCREGVDLLCQPEAARYLNFIRESYRYIIVDLPPILMTSEPVELSGMLDGILMVVRAWSSKKHIVRDAINAVDKAKLLGVVMNDEYIANREYGVYGGYYPTEQRSFYHRLVSGFKN